MLEFQIASVLLSPDLIADALQMFAFCNNTTQISKYIYSV